MIEQTRVVENGKGEMEEQISSSSATVYQENRKPTLYESLKVLTIFIVCSLTGIFAIGYLLGIGWFSAVNEKKLYIPAEATLNMVVDSFDHEKNTVNASFSNKSIVKRWPKNNISLFDTSTCKMILHNRTATIKCLDYYFVLPPVIIFSKDGFPIKKSEIKVGDGFGISFTKGKEVEKHFNSSLKTE